MSNESGQEEQHTDWWGDPISEGRQAGLDTLAKQQRAWAERPEATRGHGPLTIMEGYLTGADVFWLAQRALAGPDSDAAALAAVEEPLRSQNPSERRSFVLLELHLEQANLSRAQLKGANLSGANLEQAFLPDAQLEGAWLREAHLQGAFLSGAHLEQADLSEAQMQGAFLNGAHLQGADLRGANLEQADLNGAHLEGARLGGAWLDSKTEISNTTLDRKTQLGDIHWSGVGSVDLTQINWDNVPILGDEHEVSFTHYAKDYKAVVRAYRQLAAQLRAQGMAEDADRFSYRAQIRQRGVLLRTFHLPQYGFSWVLYLLAGYGYRPGRTLFWYLATIATFAFGYVQVTRGVPFFGLREPHGTQALQWYEALVLSLASFHGRGFFPQGINLGDPVAILAAGEAVIGLFVEISFIATFTQRYFANK